MGASLLALAKSIYYFEALDFLVNVMKSRLISQVIKSRSVASIYAPLENNFFIYTDFPQAFLSLNKGD